MKGLFLLALLAFPAIILTFSSDSSFVARAEEDEVDTDDDVDVEGEGEDTGVVDEGGEEEDLTKTGASPDADTTILFTKPSIPTELPAGQVVDFLVGFLNRGSQDFVIETLEASFRYPMDFSFYIQNFTTIGYNKPVKPDEEATLSYSFLTPEVFAGRPIGLNVHLNYRDAEGNLFGEAVFNETISVVEVDEGFEFETFFLYVFLAAIVILLLVIGQQFLTSASKKRVTKKPVVETGTNNVDDVDYEWLPKQMLTELNRTSPKSSPKASKNHTSPKAAKLAASKQQSPRQRKVKRSAGRDD